MQKIGFCLMVAFGSAITCCYGASESEIRVDMRLANADFIIGESTDVEIDIANSSPATLEIGGTDRFFIEVFRASDHSQLERISKRRFVKPFRLLPSKGQKFTVHLDEHYGLGETRRYLVRPVLAHGGYRYEGATRAFDVVEGIRVAGAMQMFANREGLRRNFSLVYWSRGHAEHIFLKASDEGSSARRWQTKDLGPILRLDKPVVSVMPGGEIVVLHRLNADQFLRSEFWSLPDELTFRSRETVRDPETAATARVRELYKEGGVKPVDNPWYKFW